MAYDDDYVELLADQLGARADVREDVADELAGAPLTDVPLELERSVSTARWVAHGAEPPPSPE